METAFSVLDTLSQRDRKVIWHPFTQMKTAGEFIPIVRGQGVYLYAEDGTRYLDAISSWWVNLHGHCHPYISDRINAQLAQLEHVTFGDFTHPPAIELAERLLAMASHHYSKVFYTDNGATSVEVALKMALQFWSNQDPSTSRAGIISFKGGYHGDTFGAMSAAGRTSYNRPFWSHLFPVESIDPPLKGKEEASLKQLKEIIEKNRSACFIFEPLIQGSGGMVIHSAEGLDALLELCRRHGVITIADEVMTGFGRTGPLLATDLLRCKPDILCLSKGLTGGYLPLAATLCKEEIFQQFLWDDKSKALLHGHTYCANPLACAAALASFDLSESDGCSRQRSAIEQSHKAFCRRWQGNPNLSRCETLGTILVLEYKTKEEASYFSKLRDRLYKFFLSRNILLRPLGNVLYVLPPYCISSDDLDNIYQAISVTLDKNGDFQ